MSTDPLANGGTLSMKQFPGERWPADIRAAATFPGLRRTPGDSASPDAADGLDAAERATTRSSDATVAIFSRPSSDPAVSWHGLQVIGMSCCIQAVGARAPCPASPVGA